MSLAGSTTLPSGQSAPIPRLAEPFEPRPAADLDPTSEAGKKKKRSLFGFGKKRADDVVNEPSKVESSTTTLRSPIRRQPGSPIQTTEVAHSMLPSSPGRHFPSSPRVSSPAGSQIFERDVQESNAPIPNSPAIPSHIQTENHIPSVLCASSEAITDDHLDPDSVEIITHSSHQPAAVTVTGVPQSPGGNDTIGSWADELASFSDRDLTDSASNYGSFDATDVRRLSFISFADVVQSEHGGGGGGLMSGSQRDSIHLAGLTSLASVGITNRSPSPIRSPVSSAGGGPGTSPPTSKSGSIKGLDLSPARKPLGSPTSAHHHPLSTGGELNIETMSQALRRTGSRDMSSFRSMSTSPIEGPSR